MLIIISYYIISGLLFYFFYKYLIVKIDNVYLKKAPFIFSFVNVTLSIVFLGMYLLNPMTFSSNYRINSELLYMGMVVFSTYFYIIAPAISTGNLGIMYYYKKQTLLSNNLYYLVTLLNGLSVFCFGLLTYQLFA